MDNDNQTKSPENTNLEKTENKQEKSGDATLELMSFDDFIKFDLRVAQIIEAERVAKSNKLLKLQINLGEILGGMRQIVAGIGQHYEPQDLIGRKIVVVTNLKPAKLMGEVSNGMLLASSTDDGALELISVAEAMPVGARVR